MKVAAADLLALGWLRLELVWRCSMRSITAASSTLDADRVGLLLESALAAQRLGRDPQLVLVDPGELLDELVAFGRLGQVAGR